MCQPSPSLKNKLRSHNIFERIKRIIFQAEDFLYEHLNGYEFSGFINANNLITNYNDSLKNSYSYMPMWNRNIRAIFKEIDKIGIIFDNFIDIGSGKGKVCIYASSRREFKRVIGIEFSQPLIDIAEKNRKIANLKNIVFFNCDATQYELPNKNNLIFLFNPFNEITLHKFIMANLTHFQDNNSVIAYINDVHGASLSIFGFMPIFRDQNRKISLYIIPKLLTGMH